MPKNTVMNLPEGVSYEQVAAWKQQYGEDKIKIATLCVDVPEKRKDVIVRVPDRNTYNMYDKWSNADPSKSRDILINSCLLSHTEIVKADDALYFSCCYALTELLPLHKAIVADL